MFLRGESRRKGVFSVVVFFYKFGNKMGFVRGVVFSVVLKC